LAQNTSLKQDVKDFLWGMLDATAEKQVGPGTPGEKEAAEEIDKSGVLLVAVPMEGTAQEGSRIISSIGKDAKLIKYAEEAGQSVQKGLDHLVGELQKGNTNPGLGTKSLGNGISYARARDGARVFFRQAGEQIEILAKASKANEAKVINYLNSLY